MGEIDRPQRRHLPAAQVDHRDLVGVDVLVDDHLAPHGVQRHVIVPDHPQQPAPLAQRAIVSHQPARRIVAAQRSLRARPVKRGQEIHAQRADRHVIDVLLDPGQPAHVAHGHLVLHAVIDHERGWQPRLVLRHQAPVARVHRRASLVSGPHRSRRRPRHVGRKIVDHLALPPPQVVGHQPRTLGIVDALRVDCIPAWLAAQRQPAQRLQRARVIDVPVSLDASCQDQAAVGVERSHPRVLVLDPRRGVLRIQVTPPVGDPHDARPKNGVAERRTWGRLWHARRRPHLDIRHGRWICACAQR